MDDAIQRFKREPPVFLYKGHQVIIIADARGHYSVRINGQPLRARDPYALRFRAYGFAQDCAIKTIDRKVAQAAERLGGLRAVRKLQS